MVKAMGSIKKTIRGGLIITVRRCLFIAGGCFLLLFSIAFTRLPYDVHRWLGNGTSGYSFTPSCIFVLGGSGMPSESNLIRLYYAGRLGVKFSAAKLVIVHPLDEEVIGQMRHELIIRCIDSSRISVMMQGTNTREQALMVAKAYPELMGMNCLVITSPENIKRTVRTFKKVGFNRIVGVGAFENALFVDLTYSGKRVGTKWYSPNMGKFLSIRYNFWNYLKLEISCIRECFALAYYKVNGWI